MIVSKLSLHIFIALTLWLWPLAGATPGVDLLHQAGSVSLKSIVEHKKALTQECANYHEFRLRQLDQLLALHQQVHLAEPLTFKVPAICLFLLQNLDATEATMRSGSAHEPDMINWIYTQNQVNKRPKRRSHDTTQNSSDTSLLADFLFEPNATQYANDSINDIKHEPILDEFRHDLDRLIEDKRFKLLVDKHRNSIGSQLSPVVLIPGLLGSRLQARTNKRHKVNILCSKNSDWQDVWLSIKLFLPMLVDCWLDNVWLEYDPITGFTKNPPGIQVRVPDFGSVESVRFLDLHLPTKSEYFATLIDNYERLGYTPDKNLLAAPYDFRLSPNQLDHYFQNLKALIERAQSENGNKVTLVCHSMGCPHLLVFLRQQTVGWRQARLRKMVALSSPWGGAVKALKVLLVGDSLDVPLLSGLKVRRLARTFPSIAFLLPQGEIFENGTLLALVKEPKREYRSDQLAELMRNAGLGQQLAWFNQTASLIRPLEPLPDLEVDCIHSLNVPTPETLVFEKPSDIEEAHYELINGDGDGTVNRQSLLVCREWARLLPEKVRHRVVMNTNHVGVLSNKKILRLLSDDVLTSS